MKRLFTWNMDNFKFNFLSRGQPGSKSINKFFLWPFMCSQTVTVLQVFFGNLIFAATPRTFSGNRLNRMLLTSTIRNIMKENSEENTSIDSPGHLTTRTGYMVTSSNFPRWRPHEGTRFWITSQLFSRLWSALFPQYFGNYAFERWSFACDLDVKRLKLGVTQRTNLSDQVPNI